MKKFIPILIILIAAFGYLFFKEIKKSRNISIKHSNVPIISKDQVYIPLYKTDNVYGNPGAPVTIVEFTDFNCKKCSTVHKEIIDYIEKNPDKARLVWRGFAQTKILTKPDHTPHIASACAGEQKSFWKYVNKAMADKNLTATDIKTIATEVELDDNSWMTCLQLGSNPTVSSTLTANQFGIKKLPVIFVNNYYINTDEEISVTDLLNQFIK